MLGLVHRQPRAPGGDDGLGDALCDRHGSITWPSVVRRATWRHAPADRLCRAGVLFHPEHQGAVPRRVARRDSGRRAVAHRAVGSSPGTHATSRRWNVIHGSIAAVVVFLLWIYVSAVILLYGVEMTASYARLQDASVRHTGDQQGTSSRA